MKRAGKDAKMGEFQWMNAPAAAEKRLSLVLNARGQEKDLRDFSPKNARNALGRESALVPSVVAPASFKLRHNQTDYEPRYIPAPVSRQSGARRVPGKNCYAELFPELVAAAKALQAERQRLAAPQCRYGAERGRSIASRERRPAPGGRRPGSLRTPLDAQAGAPVEQLQGIPLVPSTTWVT